MAGQAVEAQVYEGEWEWSTTSVTLGGVRYDAIFTYVQRYVGYYSQSGLLLRWEESKTMIDCTMCEGMVGNHRSYAAYELLETNQPLTSP